LSSRPATVVVLLLAVFVAENAKAKVFYSQSEALELAFPNAEEVASDTFILDEDQVERIESLAKSELDSKLVKIYTGMREGEVLGYALIDVHNVRTLPEAFSSKIVRSRPLFASEETSTEWWEPRFLPAPRPAVSDEPSRITRSYSRARISGCAS
jgi:hypothetical protein